MAIGAYSVLVFMTQRLLWPLTRLGETFDLYQRAMASSTRVLDVLNTPQSLTEGDISPDKDEMLKSDIEFESVTFRYPGREDVFSELNLTIKGGEMVGIVGSTGSGKTTLVRMLLRFVEASSGEVKWCGVRLEDWKLQRLRESISLVDQHITLFPTSILENIRYGKSDADDEGVFAAARAAEATDFIEALPEKWDTLIGEGGHRLSGGQRQRIAIARAVLKDAPLLLLDEATSAVDNETEAALQRSIESVTKGRTAVIIAHRLSTVRKADRIIVLDNGCVVEDGSHEILVERGGIYARLWAVQTGE
ncbi:MAG: Lipid A export ATP-binding/permease protein MsbA [Marine Group II euryarchaeote MED-G33]|nr:MAG: Lipid A export ATP-binding/permease protein MsbA [Marine Group II euryarchaeote MED-G33]